MALPRSTSFSFGGSTSAAGAGAAKPTFSFGGTSAAPATSQPAAATTQPSFSFGGAAQTQPQQQQPNVAAGTTGGGLFGGFGQSTTQQPQQQQGQQGATTGFSLGGGFGQQPKPAATGSGLFGGFGQSQPAVGATSTFGGFGSSTQNQAQAGPSSSLFSLSQPQQQQQATSSFLQPQQQQQQPGASPFLSHPYYARERFNDLPANPKKLIEELDDFIAKQGRIKEELKTQIGDSRSVEGLGRTGKEVYSAYRDAERVREELASLYLTLESDLVDSQQIASKLERDRTDHANLYEIASNYRTSLGGGATNAGSAATTTGGRGEQWRDWPLNFFARAADEFQGRIERYRSTMEQIERHLASIHNRDQHTPQAISDVIQAQHSSFMALTSNVAALHAEVEALKRDYTRWYQQQHGMRDPFAMGGIASAL